MAVNTELYSLKGSELPYTPKISERLLECSEEGYTSGFGGFSNESSLSKFSRSRMPTLGHRVGSACKFTFTQVYQPEFGPQNAPV